MKAWKSGGLKLRVSILDEDGKGKTSWYETFREREDRKSRLDEFKAIRHALGLTQAGMAAALHVATKTLQGWEIGKPIPDPIFLLAELMRDLPAVRKRLLAA